MEQLLKLYQNPDSRTKSYASRRPKGHHCWEWNQKMGGVSEHEPKPNHCDALQPQPQPQPRLFDEGSVVEVQTDEEGFRGVYFLATIIPNKSKRNLKKIHVEYQNLLVREGGTERLKGYVYASFLRPAPPPPQEDVKGFELNDSVDAFYKDGWWIGVVTRVLEGGRFIVTFQDPLDELEFGLAQLRFHWDWCDRKWVRPEKQPLNKLNEGLIPEAYQQDTIDKSSEDFLCTSPVNDMPIIASPPATDNKSPDNRSRGMTISSKQSETGESAKKRKRGRPRKESSPHTLITDGDIVSHEFGIKDGDSHIAAEVVMTDPELALLCRTDKLTDVSDCRNAENVNAEAPDDEPLSKWIEGMQSPPPVFKDSEMFAVNYGEQCVEKSDNIVYIDKSEKQKKSGVYPSSYGSGAVMPNEQQSLPFARSSLVWKTIESMEVFQRMPQSPHFQPLIHLKESAREGMAVGYMVTFSIVVEKASKLQKINDIKTVIDDILETLADLEKYGFDVRVVKYHVIGMLAMKHEKEKQIEDMNGINMQTIQHNIEKQNIDKEISEIKEQILELQGRVSVAESVREKEDNEIVGLQSKLRKVEESISIVERGIQNLSASFMN